MDSYQVLKNFTYCEDGISAVLYQIGDVFTTKNTVDGLLDAGFLKEFPKGKKPKPEPELDAAPEPELDAAPEPELDNQARQDIVSPKKLGLRK